MLDLLAGPAGFLFEHDLLWFHASFLVSSDRVKLVFRTYQKVTPKKKGSADSLTPNLTDSR
jgi:hypothetical protein